MAGREFLRPDPDDWFANFALSSPRPPPPPVRRLTGEQVAVAAALLALIAVFGGLAAAGVFSAGTKPATVAVTTAPPATRIHPYKPPPKPSTRLTVQAPPVVLTPGDHGSEVRALQRSLVGLGYSPGTIDGIYGPKTEHALKAFQAASGLATDGVLGPKTLAALKEAVRHPRQGLPHGPSDGDT